MGEAYTLDLAHAAKPSAILNWLSARDRLLHVRDHGKFGVDKPMFVILCHLPYQANTKPPWSEQKEILQKSTGTLHQYYKAFINDWQNLIKDLNKGGNCDAYLVVLTEKCCHIYPQTVEDARRSLTGQDNLSF